MKKIFSSLPLQLVCAMVLAALFNLVVCNQTVRVFFTVSSLIKEVLEFFLPAVVFFFVAGGIASFAKNSLAMVALLLTLATVSNALTSLYTYVVGMVVLSDVAFGADTILAVQNSVLVPLCSFNLPVFLRADYAMIAALLVGCGLAFAHQPAALQVLLRGKQLIEKGLSSFFIPVLPFYVFGFFLKMMRELPVAQLVSAYGMVFVLSIFMQVVWLWVAYYVATLQPIGRTSGLVSAFTTALPSYLTALGTMSSIATLPVSLVAAEKNTANKTLSQFAMPILANIHLMGDAVCTPLFALATMKLFFGVVPALQAYLMFVGYLCLNMLAVSGIPGGGIIVMLPILKSLFGFTAEMLSVMTALYLLQDGFGTAANVMGDGALVILLNRISTFFGKGAESDGRARRK
jgi:Na+/H+-dicarboxylate symporter